jgi:hypothetical protein
MADVVKGRTGPQDVLLVAPSASMSQTANLVAMGNSIAGRAEKPPAIPIPILNEEPVIRRDASSRGEMASRDALDMKAAGSAMKLPIPMMLSKPTTRNRICEAVNGAVTATVLTVNGTAVPDSNRILSGWIPQTMMSLAELIPRKILSGGRSA